MENENLKVTATPSDEAVLQYAGGGKRKSKLDRWENIVAFLFVLLPLIGFAVFTVGSMIFSAIYSFTSYNPVRGVTKPVGFKNYTDLFTSLIYAKSFTRSITNTLVLLLSVPLGLIFGLVLALLISSKELRGKKIYQALFYLPAVSSAVALNIVWRYVFNPEFGLLNQLIGSKIYWLSDDTLIKIAIIVKNTWAGMGGTMILYLAGMLNIAPDYYEAADMDGASRARKFFSITLPMLTPITFYLLIVGIIGGLQSYADSQIFAAGDEGAQTIVYFVWARGINQSRYGIASAASILLAIAIMAITLVQFKLSNKWVFEE